MSVMENVTDFYKKLPDHAPTCVPLESSGMGHINIFARDTCSAASPYSRRDFYKVSLIIGTGKIFYADKWVQIDRPAVLFSNPFVPYSWEIQSKEQSGWYCLFTEAFIQHSERVNSLQDSPLFKIGANPIFFPDEAQIDEISSIYQKMIREMQSTYAHKYDILRSYLHLLIHEALKADPAANFSSYSNGSTRVSGLFVELLERQFPIDSPGFTLQLKTPTDFAQSLSVHVNHLNRSVKEITGKTTSEHIAARIAKEARALLLHTDWSVSEIAYSLGFEYPSYFTLFFKKHTGTSPSQVRHSNI
ncbi:helix-turn-helix domain-containing protein [uncultured Bacteroides sp.]|uniref:helix-turn-helix domain-containing protein n=1 Tax=uncultured Bacteroides sp. TaxID=162156 RepID=UPI002AAA8F55|nr:helix-turn-helix domain-containing protein [uncultured Bacteroides sp.]